MAVRNTHCVYVVELHPDVWFEPKFKRSNPDYLAGKPFVYVGMTGLDKPVMGFGRLSTQC